MTQECKLVHGDLSEYNMLYHDGELHIIDVSQSVERDHPHALDFLKRDCVNVNRFFADRGCATASVMDLFEFVTAADVGNEEDRLDAMIEAAQQRTPGDA